MDTPQPPLKIAIFFLNTNQKDPKGHPVKSKVSNPRDHILWYIHHFWPFGKMWSLLMPISPFDTAQCRGHLGHYGPCSKEPNSLIVVVDINFFNYIDLHPFLLLNQHSPSKSWLPSPPSNLASKKRDCSIHFKQEEQDSYWRSWSQLDNSWTSLWDLLLLAANTNILKSCTISSFPF